MLASFLNFFSCFQLIDWSTLSFVFSSARFPRLASLLSTLDSSFVGPLSLGCLLVNLWSLLLQPFLYSSCSSWSALGFPGSGLLEVVVGVDVELKVRKESRKLISASSPWGKGLKTPVTEKSVKGWHHHHYHLINRLQRGDRVVALHKGGEGATGGQASTLVYREWETRQRYIVNERLEKDISWWSWLHDFNDIDEDVDVLRKCILNVNRKWKAWQW